MNAEHATDTPACDPAGCRSDACPSNEVCDGAPIPLAARRAMVADTFGTERVVDVGDGFWSVRGLTADDWARLEGMYGHALYVECDTEYPAGDRLEVHVSSLRGLLRMRPGRPHATDIEAKP